MRGQDTQQAALFSIFRRRSGFRQTILGVRALISREIRPTLYRIHQAHRIEVARRDGSVVFLAG